MSPTLIALVERYRCRSLSHQEFIAAVLLTQMRTAPCDALWGDLVEHQGPGPSLHQDLTDLLSSHRIDADVYAELVDALNQLHFQRTAYGDSL